MDALDALAGEVGAGLPKRRGTRVYRDGLMQVLVGLRPELATSPDRARRLAEVLEHLENQGVVRPSKGHSPFLGVDLPTSVQVVDGAGSAVRAENPARRYPWVAEMAWAAAGPRRAPDEHERLVQLSEWIAANRGRSGVPVRERSLEVFGDDKTLGDVLDRVLREHPETIEALAVERVHPPMAVQRVDGAAGREVLVVENHTTFHSAVAALGAHVAAGVRVRFGHVGYGAGGQLEAILPSLHDLEPSAIEYFGDLDPDGLAFAAAGARSCRSEGLPELRPAVWLYTSLLDRGRPQTKRSKRTNRSPKGTETGPWPEDGLSWLGPTLAAQLQETLVGGQWLAQEWVGVEILTSDPEWCLNPSQPAVVDSRGR